MDVKKGVVAGFLAGIAMVIADMAVWGATQGYLMPLYQASAAVWKPMEPLSTWLAQMWAVTIVDGILFGIVYSVLYNGIPGNCAAPILPKQPCKRVSPESTVISHPCYLHHVVLCACIA